ncbi:MAG: transposase, partial [Candidatus Cloacimonadaceae bacterium]|nr:transposase [Candidatus Cloacimonadaceae bacterium]
MVKLKNKEKIMTQPKRKKNEGEEFVKLFQETNPGDLLKVFKHSIRSIIDTELSRRLGADRYERSEDRNNYRNGYRERKKPLSTSMGPITIRIPKLRR